MIRARVAIGVLASLLLSCGCRSSKYVRFVSPYGDYTCEVPWGWAVYLDSTVPDYTSATFAGPLDPDFFRGTPSLSIRWYAYRAPHRVFGMAAPEMYGSTRDFTRQMLREVYGPKAYREAAGDRDERLAASGGPATPDATTVSVAGMQAMHYVVYNTMVAPKGVTLGVVQDGKGHVVIRQRHAYVLLPLARGFYAIVYPATREGYEKYKSSFFHLVNTFRLLKEGPVRPAARPSAR